MSSAFLTLDTVDDWQAVLERSASEPVLIFKHSPTCGVSAMAHAELSEWLTRGGRIPVYLVSVRAQRALSTAIGEHFSLRHESPQVLLVNGGGLAWHASHFRVTPSDIDAALARLSRVSLGP